PAGAPLRPFLNPQSAPATMATAAHRASTLRRARVDVRVHPLDVSDGPHAPRASTSEPIRVRVHGERRECRLLGLFPSASGRPVGPGRDSRASALDRIVLVYYVSHTVCESRCACAWMPTAR